MHELGRNPASYEPNVDDSEAVRLQIAQEASQNDEASTAMVASHQKAEPVAVLAPVEKNKQSDEAWETKEAIMGAASAQMENPKEAVAAAPESQMEKIMAALQGGLGELRTATLSRQEVSKIEDLLYDFKRELYKAESCSREKA